MVTGDPGAGKTRVLQELVRRQAEGYIHGKTARLLLYVNAQGRALARLHEALATELQDLKVGLTYHSIAALTRLGILVPVIDGFDELLGVSGYDDAFSSLAGFLEQLNGEGQLIASARSVYYEEEFLSRADRISATSAGRAWSHVSVRVDEWSDEERRDYLTEWITEKKLSDAEAAALRNNLQDAFTGRNASLAARPLFFTRVVELLQDPSFTPVFENGDDLLHTLVREYSNRELKEKLLDRQSKPLLTNEQFEGLMRELAQEMWNQETREIDSSSVRFVAEYFATVNNLTDATRQIIVERIPALAFLGRGESPNTRSGIAFEHELFFFYFLARSIAPEFQSDTTDIRIILSRSALPEFVADRVALELMSMVPVEERAESNALQGWLDRLAAASASEWRRGTQVRENAGLLVMALLREYAGIEGNRVDAHTIRATAFPGSHLRNVTFVNCSLVDMEIRRTDLSDTIFLDCDAQNVHFFEPMVDPRTTRLQLKGLKVDGVSGIRVRSGDETVTSYDPSYIGTTLKDCGAPISVSGEAKGFNVSQDDIALLERLMRAYHRANPVCVEDDNLKNLFENPRWKRLQSLLDKHQVVTIESRPAGGRPKRFLRRQFRPEQIMSGLANRVGTDKKIRAFWEDLESGVSIESGA